MSCYKTGAPIATQTRTLNLQVAYVVYVDKIAIFVWICLVLLVKVFLFLWPIFRLLTEIATARGAWMGLLRLPQQTRSATRFKVRNGYFSPKPRTHAHTRGQQNIP